MRKGIYTYYKERLIEIGGNNKCLYLKSASRKNTYDLGRIFEGRDEKVADLVDFLWSGKKYALTIIDKSEKDDIIQNLDQSAKTPASDIEPDITDNSQKPPKQKRDAEERLILENEVIKIKELKREIEEVERETGRYEMYLGYPFVFGCIPQGTKRTLIKAPLILFPIKIDIEDETTVEIRLNEEEKIHINHALIYAYAQSKKINVDQLELEYDKLSGSFKSVSDVVQYLNDAKIRIGCQTSKNVFDYSKFKEPQTRPELSVRYAAILGRFPLSNSIYNDYSVLEKKKLSNDAINELLKTEKPLVKKPRKKDSESPSYAVKMLDYSQSEVVKKVDENGNMVIYGPPGTGKSETIVNIITDAICKSKRILVVSQKKAALDVVYNRLGALGECAMYITDEGKQKRTFYEKCINAHQRETNRDVDNVEETEREYAELESRISKEEAKLDTIHSALSTVRNFGLSLTEMYSLSYKLKENSSEYSIYLKMVNHPELMKLGYQELNDALFSIRSMNLGETYFKFMEDKEKNPLIDYMLPDIDINTLSEVKGQLEDISKSKKGLFNIAKYPYYRQVLAYYPSIKNDESLDYIVRMQTRLEHPKELLLGKYEKSVREAFLATYYAIESYAKEYQCLYRVLTQDGYFAVIDNILRGNTSYIKLVYEALDTYIAKRDFRNLIAGLDENKLNILNFAYSECKNYSNYLEIIERMMSIRIYHEVLKCEKLYETELSNIIDFEDTVARIYKLKQSQLEVAERLCSQKSSRDYVSLYENAKNNKDYLYQISKKQKYWPIRKTMDVYGDFILSLFPCWLLSPENVSSLLPLRKNMFDVVIFDEASQVFIESTIPSIFRGKTIVVAGDDKQLRPSTAFIKRYLGAGADVEDDYATQAALEVDSLLDLAVSRFESANLGYHYRSKYRELIDFSDRAFYKSALTIAPNISKNTSDSPIERYKVPGKWIDRKNTVEAKKVAEILKDILKNKKNNETVGIITFNSDQQACIKDTLDKEAKRDAEFRTLLLNETARTDNGEDVSLFIKNLENVQGDERDIIIFSIGYAECESGKVYTAFGPLSQEGGENRLNVAITRAKSKVIVVTSIEPEELNVDNAKHIGPKLLQKYLAYARALSSSDRDGARAILDALRSEDSTQRSMPGLNTIEQQIKERLEKLGYTVDTSVGNAKNKFSLAIYDPEKDRYLLGIELDKDAFSTQSSLERDVYKPRFLESRGWNTMRVWCRDWWLYPNKVIKSIEKAIEKVK